MKVEGAPADAFGGELLEEEAQVGVAVGVPHDVGGEGTEGPVVHRRLGDAPDGLLSAMSAIGTARERIAANVPPLLALEAMAISLRLPR